MSISLQARGIAPSPTFALNEKARLLRAKGEPVINLGIGEPKNKTPITAVLSSAARLREGDVKYTPVDGIPSLKQAIIRYTEENYGRVVAPENVIVTTGAKQSIFNILYTLLNPQDEVILLAPYWVSYPEMVKMCYANPVVVSPEDGTFYHRMEEIERVVSSFSTALIILPAQCILLILLPSWSIFARPKVFISSWMIFTISWSLANANGNLPGISPTVISKIHM
jgi:aspartate aminotransferase